MYDFRYVLDFGFSHDFTRPWRIEVSAGLRGDEDDHVVAVAYVNQLQHAGFKHPDDAIDQADAVDGGALAMMRAIVAGEVDDPEHEFWASMIYLDRLEVQGPVDLDVLVPLLLRHIDDVLAGTNDLIACYPNGELTDERLAAAGLRFSAGGGRYFPTSLRWPESKADRWAPEKL